MKPSARIAWDPSPGPMVSTLLDQLVAIRFDLTRGIFPTGERIECSDQALDLLVERLDVAIATAKELTAMLNIEPDRAA
jgi:hypothetical protein